MELVVLGFERLGDREVHDTLLERGGAWLGRLTVNCSQLLFVAGLAMGRLAQTLDEADKRELGAYPLTGQVKLIGRVGLLGCLARLAGLIQPLAQVRPCWRAPL